MDMTSVFAPITKSAEQDDGSLYVYGKATGSDIDLDQQRCDPDWLKRAMPEWFKSSQYGYGGNIREQHDSKRAIGVATEHEIKDDGHWITAHIVDPVAVMKTKAGVFSGFSIGISRPRIEKTEGQEWIKAGDICEVSLVDRPCYPTATFTMCKSARPGMSNILPGDYDHNRQLVRVNEYAEIIEKGDKPEPEFTVTLAERLTPEQQAALADKASDEANEQLDRAVEKAAPQTDADWQEAANDAAMNGGSGCGCCNMCICNPGPRGTDADMKAFDLDAAKALIADTLAKADAPPEDIGVVVPPISPPRELDDIRGAKAAIALIAQLIQSEASEMVCAPNEDTDIELLLQAVSALRCFIMREKGEPGGDGMMMLAAEPELDKKAKYNAEQLRDMLSAGKAIKNKKGEPSYPIADKEDLQNAIHAVGRGSGDHDAIRAYIKKRASALGASDMIPESWNKDADPDLTKVVSDEQTVTETETSAKASRGGEAADGEDGEGAQGVGACAEAESTKASDSGEEGEQTGEAVQGAEAGELSKVFESVINKAFSSDTLDDEDNSISKAVKAIVKSAQESTAKSITELMERLEAVEKMAQPGGPQLRRTEIERGQARKGDLEREVFKFKDLAKNTNDTMLRKGYLQKVSALEAEIRTI